MKVETKHAAHVAGQAGLYEKQDRVNVWNGLQFFPPVDVSVSTKVIHRSLSAEALLWWLPYWQTRETVPSPQIYLSLVKSLCYTWGLFMFFQKPV